MENKKETAIKLIDEIIFLAKREDKELSRLHKMEDPTYVTVGEGPVSYHLGILKELVQEL
jgi:hypothetical protein